MDPEFAATLRTIVGTDNVLEPESPDFASSYADPFAFTDEFSEPPAGAVLPRNVDEVQAVVRAANDAGVPLWTISRGRNLGYGGAAPRNSRCVVLDLHLMNTIRMVDADAAYAVVEPGVSFFDLHAHLRERDIPLWASVPDLGGGSLIGNALERGFGYTAYGDHSAFLCGMEVVLPTGELIRTGMAAASDSAQAHMYRGGFGPSVDGLFQQSNLGIVTSAGIWLMPEPERAAAVLIGVRRREDLGSLVDTIRPLMLNRTIDSVAIVGNALAILSQLMPRQVIFADAGPIPDDVISSMADRIGIGMWNAKFGLYGPTAIVDAKLATIRAAVSHLADVIVDVRTYSGNVPPENVHPADRAQMGIPSSDLIQMAAWRGGTPAHTDFSLVASTDGVEAQRMVDLVQDIIESAGLDHAGGFTMFGRHAIMLSLLSFDQSDPADRSLVAGLFSELIERCAEAGYTPYRAHPAFMDQIADLYNFNNSALRRFITTLKDATDPRGILSPGKQGIWPSQA